METKKKALGKGLEQLFSNNVIDFDNFEDTVVEENKKDVTEIDIDEIRSNPYQPRKTFDSETLNELAKSIEQYGVVQPIIVKKSIKGYELVAGERRTKAAKIAGLKKIPAIIKDFDDQEMMEIALIENIQRRDLNPIEEALAYKSLIDEYNLKQEEVADRVSKSRTAVTNSMRLLKLAEQVQTMLINEELSMGHARALLSIEKEEVQVETAKAIVERKLSVRETEKLVKAILNPKQAKLPIPSTNDVVYEKLSDKLKEIMGTKVNINHKKGGKGKIEIEYYSQDELERLLELFDSIQNQ